MRATSLLLFLIISLLSSSTILAQTCGHCHNRPSVATFDFDIQVATPNSADTTANLWPEWKALFRLSSVVATKLFNSNKACIKFTQPPSFDSGDTVLLSVGGESFTNLPTNPNISSNLSKYGNYFITGSVQKQGANCLLRVELRASCSRKLVSSTEVSFQLESLVGNISSVAGQAASALSPLSDQINTFEMRERSENRSLALDQFGSTPIVITPSKKTLKAGESTDVLIEVKDCDGLPLQGREIIFSEASFEKFALDKTVGGVVTPARVTTDAQGKAKVVFKLNGGASEAVINAHSFGMSVKGCPNVFTGSAYINIKAIYYGYVRYSLTNESNCTEESISGCLKVNSKSRMGNGIEYMASFYMQGEKGGSLSVHISNNDAEKDPGKVPDCMESGSYLMNKNNVRTDVIVCESIDKGDTYISQIRQSVTGGLDYGVFSVSADGSFASLALDLHYNTTTNTIVTQTTMPSSNTTTEEKTPWSVNFDTMIDKELKYSREESGNRIKHTFEVVRNQNPGCGINNTEKIKIVVYEE